MYRIAWKSKTSDESGFDEYLLSFEEAEKKILEVEKRSPELVHWIEAQPLAPLKIKGHWCSYGESSFTPRKSPSPSLSPISPNEPPALLKIKGHRCSYGDMTFVSAASPIENPPSPLPIQPSNVNWSPLKLPKIKKTCSFGEVTVFEFPILSPCSSPVS
jgi:hypothetical protein